MRVSDANDFYLSSSGMQKLAANWDHGVGSQQYTRKDGKGKADVFANAIKHDYRSPNPTTRWSDVIKLK